MKIKTTILLLSLFLLTGCDIEYNISINDNKYNELILIKEPEMINGEGKSFEFNYNYNYFKEKYPDIITSSKYNSEGIYQVLIERNENNLSYIKNNLEKYKEIVDEISLSGIINKHLKVVIKESFFSEYEINSFVVNIKVPYNVISSNSIENKNGIYKFELNKNSRNIDLKYKMTDNENNFILNTADYNIKKCMIIIIAIMFVFIIGIPLYLLFKKGK